jgi:cyclopropane fatty-acyl-phospholipid synthase-like methyltransferase
MPANIPARLLWAVDVLAVQPDERILEIGCGRGAAVELIAERLEGGRITGIDCSPVAIAAAESRNRAHLKTGRARFLNAALADVELDEMKDLPSDRKRVNLVKGVSRVGGEGVMFMRLTIVL